MNEIKLSASDLDLVVKLAGCSLAETAEKDNWVDNEGGLPEYICEVARSIKKTGKTTSQAIAIAVSRMKIWAATGKGDTKAKAAKALAEWEKMKASAKGKDVVKATHVNGDEYVFLSSTPSFNTDLVRYEFEEMCREKRNADRNKTSDMEMVGSYPYIKELWTDFLICQCGEDLQKIPYMVNMETNEVEFGDSQKVIQKYVPAPNSDNYAALSRIQEAAVKLTRG